MNSAVARAMYAAGLAAVLGTACAAEPNHAKPKPPMNSTSSPTVSVRYIVNDVAAAVAFYTTHLGFTVEIDAAPGFAMVNRGALRLALSGTGGTGGGARAMSDGTRPTPGGWNRIQVPVTDLAAKVAELRAAGLHFRSEIIKGNGGSQIILDDPSGNPIELWQAAAR